MSTTASTNYPPPSLFGGLNAQAAAFCDPITSSPVDLSGGKSPSPSSTPPKRPNDSDCGSSSGLGMPKHDGSSEVSSLASDRDSGGVPATLLGHDTDFGLSSPVAPSSCPTMPMAAQFGVPRWQPHPTLLQSHMPPMQGRPPPQPFYTMTAAPLSNVTVAASSVSGNTTGSNGNSAVAGGLQAPSPLSTGQLLTGIPPANPTIMPSVTAQNNDLFVHVEQGETISLAVGNEVQHIAGPATIRMVGHSGLPASVLPLHVPRGHSVSQIVDEKGILRHLILSPQNAVNIPTSATGLNPPMNMQSRSPHKTTVETSPSTTAGRLSPKSASPPSAVPSYPPPNSSTTSEQMNTSYAQRKRSTPNKRPAGASSTDSTTFNGTNSTENETAQQLTIDYDESERLREALNRIHQPVITRVACHEADVHWQELDTSEASSDAGPFPQIDPSEFIYEIFLYETSPNERLITQKECPPLSKFNGVRLTRLKPRTAYHVAIRASLPGRQLVGQLSPTACFRTYSIPEPPQMLRVTSRGHSFLAFSWNPPVNHVDASVLGYVLEMAKGKADYMTVYDGPAEQARITRLEPGSHYRVHVAAKNESARSEFTPPLHVNTTGNMPPTSLPTTSANTPVNYYQPIYPAGVQQHQSHSYVPSSAIKLPAPTVVSISARSVRLSWLDTPRHFTNVTLEMSDPTRTGPHNFSPVPLESYASNHNSATVSGLRSNRDYRFRLTGSLGNSDMIRSEHTIVKTHKDRYENTTYYQSYQGTDKDRMVAPVLRGFEDENGVELSWKYQSYENELTTYVLEGSTTHQNGVYNDGQNDGTAEWKLCYKGTNNTTLVQEPHLCLFRVQAIKRNVPSAWSDIVYVRRNVRNKRQNTHNYNSHARSQYHGSTYQQNSQSHQPTRHQTPPSSTVTSKTTETETFVSTIPETEPTPLSAPSCSIPKFSNITQSSMEITWDIADGEEASSDDEKRSTIFEVQRVDKQALIIHASNEKHCRLENLRPVEHVQVRIRSVIIDNDGNRTEGTWTAIVSAITQSAVTSSPQNLRLKSDVVPLTLVWDPPAQLNGSDVIEYLLSWGYSSMEENKSIDSLVMQQLASTERLEYLVDSILPAHIYAFSVVSRNEAGKSEPSNRLEYTSPPTVPTPPGHLRLEATALETLHATWTPAASNGAIIEAYKLTLQHNKIVVQQETVSTETHEFLFNGLKPETHYTLEVQAKNNVGWGKAARCNCTTVSLPPQPPILSVIQVTANTLKLKWTDANQTTSSTSATANDELLYFYLEKENENGKFTNVYEGENRSVKVKGLRESSTHRFRIRASRVRASPLFAGPWSTTFSFETTPQPPSAIRAAPTVTEISSGLFQVDWPPYKTSKELSVVEEPSTKNVYYKLQSTSKINREKGAESWKTVYEGSVNTCSVNFGNSTLSTSRQLRVLVVQKINGEEIHSPPSPITIVNLQRTPTESPRKRPTKTTSGKSTPSSMVSTSGAGTSAGPSGRTNSTVAQPTRVLPPHKMSMYKRFRRFLTWLKRSVSEQNCALFVLAVFLFFSIAIAILLNQYYGA
ncbi:hypothetical protein M3Y98_01133800 [Aphelenchoides besseyi]|nr:hypothetical protein M3Y98_01133800 [Aphelenchoides besseyi]KAI6210614.1 hypothetical protein M3Y96_00346800 [Aphelenchoides besseyi]